MKSPAMPVHPADLIHARLLRMDFEKPDFDRNDPMVGLTLHLKEEIPEFLFMKLHVELLVPVPPIEHIDTETGESVFEHPPPQAIVFVIDDVLAMPGSKPKYVLAIRPRPKTGPNDDCQKTAFYTLADAAAPHQRRDGSRRDWRNEVIRIRYCDPSLPKARHIMRNPRYEPLQVSKISDLLSWLPATGGAEDEGQAIQKLIDSADAAFSDPDPPRPKRESFGYDQYVVQGAPQEFDVDKALAWLRT